jgi:hypothetical protein
MVVAKVRERLAVSKQTTHRLYMEKFNPKKLKEVEGKEQYRVQQFLLKYPPSLYLPYGGIK